MTVYSIRTFGDPVLKQRAPEVNDIDENLVRIAENMGTTMYHARGLGLAAPQVGIQKRLFTFDLQDGGGLRTIVNPEVAEHRGEWEYDEGCLSVPGLYFTIVRPREVHVTGRDLDGNEVSIEATDLPARLFQHELDHLDGKLLIEMLDQDQRKDAMRALRDRTIVEQRIAEHRIDGRRSPVDPHRGWAL